MTLSPLGDSALVLSLGEQVDDAVVTKVRAVADALRGAPLDGIVDVVPAFATVTVFYEVTGIDAYDRFERRVSEIAAAAVEGAPRLSAAKSVEIPVCYGGEHGPDLDELAARCGMSVEAAIAQHAAADYRVQAIGFIPGFAYLGGLPRKLHTPRRATPRPSVPAGSVGIGGAQTGVYPVATPGGWNIIGRTPLVMFDASQTEPARLRAGDCVIFRPISPEEFAAWK